MEATRRELRQLLPPARFGGAFLVCLPLDVLELICSSLTLEDRVALTSCCRRLWTCPDIMKSTHLWGIIEAAATHCSTADQPLSLGHWLARHKAAVGRLTLQGFKDPALVLAGLEGGALAALKLHGMDGIGANPAGALAPLAHLGGLTELSLQHCDVRRLPPQMLALTALKGLNIAEHEYLHRGELTGIAPLAGHTQLTALRLKHCGLRWLPQQLSALGARLQLLDLAHNYFLGDWVAGSMRPLSSLSALTCLDMSCCGLLCFPPQLSAMGSLQQLRLSINHLKDVPAAAWEPLRRLTCLTLLDLGYCHLTCLRGLLSCLTALAELVLFGNEEVGPSLEQGAPAAAVQGQPTGAEARSWQPLLSLGASLTSLDLTECNIATLPAEFSSLSALVRLRLSGNGKLGDAADTAFQPLSGLVGLKVLKLDGMKLKCILPQLKVLPALEELELWGWNHTCRFQ